MASFEQEAMRRGLKEKTIASLVDEDYDSVEAIRALTLSDMEYMKITRAQQGILKKWIDEPEVPGSGTNVTSSGPQQPQTDAPSTAHTTTNINVDVSLGITDNTEQEVEDYIKAHGVKNLDKFLNDQLTKYKRNPVNIAVTGQSGAGKSSFINCVRNLFGDDDTAAAVGVQETTMTIKPYADFNNQNLVYWDLPGVGTEKFPRETYLETVDFFKYDFFLILSSERFKQDDLFLARAVHEQGKQFYFLRTKIDADLLNDKRAKPRQHDPIQLIQKVRLDCADNLKAGNLPTMNVYIISSCLEDKAKYDYPLLMDTIIRNAPDQKKASLILSMNACSEKGIMLKKTELEKRIPAVAGVASTEERLVMSQNDRIVAEVQFYKQQFGLTEDDVIKMGINKRTLTQRTMDVLGPAGKCLLLVARGISSTAALPCRLIMNITGLQKKNEGQIALVLHEALNRCAEAALEMLNLRRDGSLVMVDAPETAEAVSETKPFPHARECLNTLGDIVSGRR